MHSESFFSYGTYANPKIAFWPVYDVVIGRKRVEWKYSQGEYFFEYLVVEYMGSQIRATPLLSFV